MANVLTPDAVAEAEQADEDDQDSNADGHDHGFHGAGEPEYDVSYVLPGLLFGLVELGEDVRFGLQFPGSWTLKTIQEALS